MLSEVIPQITTLFKNLVTFSEIALEIELFSSGIGIFGFYDFGPVLRNVSEGFAFEWRRWDSLDGFDWFRWS